MPAVPLPLLSVRVDAETERAADISIVWWSGRLVCWSARKLLEAVSGPAYVVVLTQWPTYKRS